MLLIYQKRSFTLVEIIVTTVILSLVMWGVLGLFIGGKRTIMHSRDRMTASEMGKIFLDPVQTHVRQDTWDTANNSLTLGTTYCDAVGGHAGSQNPFCPSVREVDSVNYTAQYDVYAVAGTNNFLRQVKVQVNWTERSPE